MSAFISEMQYIILLKFDVGILYSMFSSIFGGRLLHSQSEDEPFRCDKDHITRISRWSEGETKATFIQFIAWAENSLDKF